MCPHPDYGHNVSKVLCAAVNYSLTISLATSRLSRIKSFLGLLMLLEIGCGPTATDVSVEMAEPVGAALSSDDLVVRFEIGGGMLPVRATDLPRWSLYGDGLVVWTTEQGEATPGFTQRVWTGRLSPDQIRMLVDFISEAGFWELDANYRPVPEVAAPDATSVRLDPAGAPDQLWSRLSVYDGQRRSQVTVYPVDWAGTPVAYAACTQRLSEIRPQQVREFEPEAFRLEADQLTGVPAAASHWPFDEIDLSVASGGLPLTLEQGAAVSEFLTDHSPLAVHASAAFEVRLLGEPPRP